MKNKVSFLAVAFVSLVIVYLNFREPAGQVIVWDQFGYYLYLPLTFIYHDLSIKDFSVIEALMQKYQPLTVFYQGIQLEDGTWVLRYTMGLAILYSPGFFAGHLFAYIFDYPMDGFSPPYQYAVLCWSIIVLVTGLFYLRLILLHFFRDRLSAVVLLLLFFGTNLFIMSTPGWILSVHIYLFTLFAMMLWHIIKWHIEHNLSSAALIGIFIGLASLTRPTEILYIIVPLMLGIINFSGTKQKLISLHLLVMIGIIFCIDSLQLIYWKKITENFFYNSYAGNPGEGIDLLSPHTISFLFSYRKGWLLYTPMMCMAILGFVVLFRKQKEFFWGFALFFIIFLYVVSSWTCWWYASCFSQRTMTQIYPLFSVPFGYFIQWIWTKKKIIKTIFVVAVIFFIVLNLFQTWQYSNGIISFERMTKKYYWSVFLRTSVPEGAEKLLLVNRDVGSSPVFNDYTEYKKSNVVFLRFENEKKSVNQIVLKDTTILFSNRVLLVDSTNEFPPGYTITFADLTDKYYAWIRVKLSIMPLSLPKDIDALLVITFNHNERGYEYRAHPVINDSSRIYEFREVQFDYLTPEMRNKHDKLQIYLWNRGKGSFIVQDIKIEKFEPFENP